MLTRCKLIAAGGALLLMASAAAAQAYGPDTCRQGFVWREAGPDDHVCVVPAIRAQAKRDNAQARYRVSTVNRDYGPDTCRTGYVWREAFEGDHVCVTPATRQRTREDNAAARSRYVNP